MKALIILLSVFTLISASTFAQTEKGRLRLGGSVSGYYTKNETDISNGIYPAYTIESKESSIAFSPVGGIFLADGLELGIKPSINWISRTTEDNGPVLGVARDAKSLNLLIGPYLNYYIGSGEKGKPFVGVNPEIGWGDGTTEILDPFSGEPATLDSDTKILMLNVTAGYAVFLNDAYILSFYAGYEFRRTQFDQEIEYESDSTMGTFRIGVAISTTFKRNQ